MWVGPNTTEEIQRQFDCLFAKRCVVSGQLFFQADDASIEEWAKARARKRMRVRSSQDLVGPGLWQDVLTPAQLQRINNYRTLQLHRASLDDGCFIVDADHWAHSPGPSSGPHFPTLLRHGTIVDLGSGKVAMADDRWLSLGFNVRRDLGSPFSHWPAHGCVKDLSDRTQHSLSGNSQSLPAIVAWQLYVFANVVRREIPQVEGALLRPSSNEFADGKDDDDMPL